MRRRTARNQIRRRRPTATGSGPFVGCQPADLDYIAPAATRGGMAEWLKALAWKACIRETVSWVRIPLPPPPPRMSAILRSRGPPNNPSRGRCFSEDLWTSPMGAPPIWFSDGPFFSQAVYSCGLVQSSVGQYFRASAPGQVRDSLAAQTGSCNPQLPRGTWRNCAPGMESARRRTRGPQIADELRPSSAGSLLRRVCALGRGNRGHPEVRRDDQISVGISSSVALRLSS
jgi:hypothetical protein